MLSLQVLEMRFRRNDGGDQRRRRALIEENLGDTGLDLAASGPSDANSACSPTEQLLPSYTDAALADRRSPITTVIPRRRWTLIVLLLSGFATIAGIEAVYGQLHLLPREMWASGFSAVDVQAPGGLAAWFCSLMLAVAALQGFQIYRLRRHKTDDYRGRYRVWLWMPLVLFLMATSVATHIHHDLANLVNRLANVTAPTETGLLWPLAYCALWTLVSLRLAFEVRKSRASLVSLTVATCCYFAGALTLLLAERAVSVMGEISFVMATTTIAMSGHLATFLTMGIYGRHVYLDSQGILPVRATKAKRKKPRKTRADERRTDEENAASNDSSRKRVRPKVLSVRARGEGSENSDSSRHTTANDTSQAEDRKSTVEASPQLMVGSDIEPQSLSDEDGGNRKLSKAERRRLRKLKRREQRRQAA